VLDPEAEVSELPGVWFSPAEIYALLEIEHLLGSLSPGLLGSRLEPLRQRLAELLERGDRGHREIRRRIRVIGPGTRRVNHEVFEAVSLGLLGRRQVFIRHLRRGDGGVTERAVSPQRLVHYRYNWYLDAWCHLRRDLRVFSVDAIRAAAVREEAAREVEAAELDRVLGAGYGIFAGATTETAVLRFTPEAARWVADEAWHSRQLGRIEADGSYRLELPYSGEPELVMDLLRHGAGVEVLAPPSLRERVARELALAARQYA
jgi:predicted DNA-binding transcriptional regulator YafY